MIYNARPVLLGLFLFLGLCLLPVFLHWGESYIGPEPVPPPADIAGTCVEPRPYMAANHMRLLLRWRETATRGTQRNRREYTATDGRVWPISLQNTCLACHADKERFCDVCHTEAAVTPDCWNCHFAPFSGSDAGSVSSDDSGGAAGRGGKS